jgi:diaminopimelate decarboxylase
VRDSAQRYKPGIALEDAAAVGRGALEAEGVELVGVMAHLGRHSTDPSVWAGMGASFAAAIGDLCRAVGGWRPEQIDVGGGYPAPRDPTGHGEAPAIETIAEALTGALRAGLAEAGVDTRGVRLEAEPGRALYADTGIHLTTVRNTKRQTRPLEWTWVETDTTEMFMADLLIEHARFGVMAASRADAAAELDADVVGMSCGFDVIAPEARLPDVSPGDVLAFLDTGAYQDACASNFNGLPRPATVLVHGAEAEVVKRAETVDEVFARDAIPARLR